MSRGISCLGILVNKIVRGFVLQPGSNFVIKNYFDELKWSQNVKIPNQQWSTARRNNLIQIMQQIDFKCFILNYLTLEKGRKMLTGDYGTNRDLHWVIEV